MDIYLIRHGESTGNQHGQFLGWADHPLSAQGERQAEALAYRLKPLGPMPVFCSDLLRARMTAECIAAAWHGAVMADARWREMHCGEFEGQPWSILMDNVQLSCAFEEDPLTTSYPGGESLAMMMTRVHEAFSEMCAREDDRLLLVSHGGPLQVVLAQILEIPPRRFWTFTLNHGGITRLRWADGWMNILSVNDTSHLEDMSSRH